VRLLTLENDRHRVRIAPDIGGAIADHHALTRIGPVALLRPWNDGDADPFALGQNVLAPFSNRISSGGFRFGRRLHRVEPNLEGERFPIHGDAFQKSWSIAEAGPQSVRLSLETGSIGPYAYRADLCYDLNAAGLATRLLLTNIGIELPFGGGFHPWFPRDLETCVEFTAAGVWMEDERHLPTRWRGLGDAPEWSFGSRRSLPRDLINNAFTGWTGEARILQPARNMAVIVKAAYPLTTLIIYSPDDAADFFCLEPVSHAVDAHNRSGQPGLIALKIGDSVRFEMTVDWHPIG